MFAAILLQILDFVSQLKKKKNKTKLKRIQYKGFQINKYSQVTDKNKHKSSLEEIKLILDFLLSWLKNRHAPFLAQQQK